jgi:glycogen operon protein
LFGVDGRQPHNSINFVTCHDGFTLFDLVSYENKHNEANGEENMDGTDDNNSWNCGVEGYSDDKEILRLRTRQVKNLFCCLFFSLGTPMMLAGDEMLRTQNGNNNAYCQDNKISWVDWLFLKKNRDIVEFCKKAISFRNRYPVLKKKKFFLGRDTSGNNILDITWHGTDMGIPDWGNPNLRTICYQLNGAESSSLHEDYLLYLILNSDRDSQNVKLPKINGKQWFRVLDTSLPPGEDFMPSAKEKSAPVNDVYNIDPRTIAVLIGA